MTEEVSKRWKKLSSLKEEKFIVLINETNNIDENEQLLHEQFLTQNRNLREAHEKSLHEMEEVKRFQDSTFETIFKKKIDRRSRYYPWSLK